MIMDCPDELRPIAVVSACMRPDGFPAFALNRVEVTRDEAENGVHYDLVEAALLAAGYEEPFVHFDEIEAPAFLHPAVRHWLCLPDVNGPTTYTPAEGTPCLASSK